MTRKKTTDESEQAEQHDNNNCFRCEDELSYGDDGGKDEIEK